MKITILGGGGFLGRKLAQRLAAEGSLGGTPVTGLILFDLCRIIKELLIVRNRVDDGRRGLLRLPVRGKKGQIKSAQSHQEQDDKNTGEHSHQCPPARRR